MGMSHGYPRFAYASNTWRFTASPSVGQAVLFFSFWVFDVVRSYFSSSKAPSISHRPLPGPPLSPVATVSKDSASSLCADRVLANMINWVFLESSGGTQSAAPEGGPGVRNVSCNLCMPWVCLRHPALGQGVCWLGGQESDRRFENSRLS